MFQITLVSYWKQQILCLTDYLGIVYYQLDWSSVDNGDRCVYERGKDASYNVMINFQYFSGSMTLGYKLFNVSQCSFSHH